MGGASAQVSAGLSEIAAQMQVDEAAAVVVQGRGARIPGIAAGDDELRPRRDVEGDERAEPHIVESIVAKRLEVRADSDPVAPPVAESGERVIVREDRRDASKPEEVPAWIQLGKDFALGFDARL